MIPDSGYYPKHAGSLRINLRLVVWVVSFTQARGQNVTPKIVNLRVP
jgi:hypothetical protein